MQTLSIWPSKTECFLNLESPPHFLRRKSRNPNVFRGFRSGFRFRETSDDLGYGFLCRCSRVNLYVIWGPKKHSFGSSVVPLALAFEEQVVVGKTDSNSADELIDEGNCEVLDDVHQDGVKKPNDLALESSKNDSENKGKRINTRALALSLRAAKTIDDIELVLGDKGDLPLQVYSTMIRGLGKDKRVNSAIVLVEWLKLKKHGSEPFAGPNLFIYNSLLGAVKQAEEFDHVEKIMNDMAMEGIAPNVVTYNTLMGIYLAQERETKALELFEEIEKKGLSPSPASYSTALLAYRRMEDGFGALDFYIDFRNKHRNGEIGKDDKKEYWDLEAAKLEDFVVRICYQIMRRWLVRTENSSTNVLKLLTCMDQTGLQIDRSGHERLIWACTRDDHYTVAKELYKRIRESDSEISLSVCNHVIWLLGKAKKWWAALEIYEDLLDKGPKPNNMSYELIVSHFNFLLTAARKKGIWKWGVGLLNKMQEKGLKPGTKEWNSVLIACSKASEPLVAIQIFTRMVENGEKPTIISYGALLSALEKGKLYDEALQVWKHMIKMGVKPNSYAYTIMASVYAAQGKFNIVESIILEMPVSGVELNVVTFNAIISACARNNMGGPAYEWFQRMEVEKIEPNEVSYEMLIEALAKDGKPKVAYDMYLRARLEGLSLSSKAYDTVVESGVGGGASINLSLLGPRPRPPEKKKRVEIGKELADLGDVSSRDANQENMGTVDD
ncbi:pentatricopeptide repeat-containing protein At3g46610-like [Cynara cardunculus var. scolymus]|uniref:Pentatricopeptide repeat-containing protein n=1 Tax=Cynara cardunculus var. scolymus TaxID=59895 RepID=A0A103YHN4_CYNCS|nr:pentatricopeptide repeat-containing protein At3g46610-like [Cynara cardunculus var. scolymus]KVI09279.1 Pentatricopeptide repeat-containing protein [Cynara cardunculus var. scolymus]